MGDYLGGTGIDVADAGLGNETRQPIELTPVSYNPVTKQWGPANTAGRGGGGGAIPLSLGGKVVNFAKGFAGGLGVFGSLFGGKDKKPKTMIPPTEDPPDGSTVPPDSFATLADILSSLGSQSISLPTPQDPIVVPTTSQSINPLGAILILAGFGYIGWKIYKRKESD